MAITINRTLKEDASRATIEVVCNGDDTTTQTIIDISEMSNAGSGTNQLVKIVGLEAIVADSGNTGGNVILTWDDGSSTTDFVTLPVGHTRTSMHFMPSGVGALADVTLTASAANISYTLRLSVEKIHGFPLSIINRQS